MRGRDDGDAESQPVVVPLVVADTVEVTTHPRERKRPDYTHRPRGAFLWALLLPLVMAEVVALKLDVEWTLSRTVWWVLGPEDGVRWWLLGFPLWGLLLWTGPHFLWPWWCDGRVLLGVTVVMLAIGVAGVLNR